MVLVVAGIPVSIGAVLAAAPGGPAGSPVAGMTFQDKSTKAPYRQDLVVSGSHFAGVHGMAFDDENRLYTTSLFGRSVHRIDPDRRPVLVETVVDAPRGESDDIAIGPGGDIVWTAFLSGKVYIKKPGQNARVLAEIPRPNGVAFGPDGTVYVTQYRFRGESGDIVAIEYRGRDRSVTRIEGDYGNLNACDIGPEGDLYSVRIERGEIVRVDLDTGEHDVVATGLSYPTAVKFSNEWRLYAVESSSGRVYRIDRSDGSKHLITRLKPALDSLSFDNNNRLFVTGMTHNAIYRMDRTTGAYKRLTYSDLAAPADVHWTRDGDVLVADVWGLKQVDVHSGTVTDLRVGLDTNFPATISASDSYYLTSSSFTGTVTLIDRAGQHVVSVNDSFELPSDAVFRDDRNILVAEYATGDVLNYNIDSDTERLLRSFDAGISSLLFHDGELYLTNVRTGTVTRYSIEHDRDEVLIDDLDNPEGLAMGPEGTLFVAEVGRERVVRYDPEEDALSTVEDDLSIGVRGPENLPTQFLPTGVTVDEHGNVYVSSDRRRLLYKLHKN